MRIDNGVIFPGVINSGMDALVERESTPTYGTQCFYLARGSPSVWP